MKRYLTIFIVLLFTFIIRVNAETYKTGDLVSYRDINFYVVSDKVDYLTLLKATPLTVDEVNKYGEGHINKFPNNTQGSASKAFDNDGYGSILYYSSEMCGYNPITNEYFSSDCKINYNESDIKYVVENWGEHEIGNNNLTLDDLGYEIRLITKEELQEYFGYNKYVASWWEKNSLDLPDWVNKYSYWTMSNDANNPGFFWIIESRRNYNRYTSSNNSRIYSRRVTDSSLVRPVVNIKKSDQILKPNNKYKSYKIGDKVNLNGIDFYVIEDSDGFTSKLKLLKSTPLTVDEVNKYGVVDEVNYINKYTYESRNTAKDVGGYGAVAYYTSSDCGYDDSNNYKYSGCKVDYESSDLKQIIDNWGKMELKINNDDFINNKFETKILTSSDLVDNLGYKYWYGTESSHGFTRTDDTPTFMKKEYQCWNEGFYLNDYGHDNSSVYNLAHVCPVVILNKTEIPINNKLVESSQSSNKVSNKVSIPDTLLRNPIFIVLVGIILIVISAIIISVVAKKNK